MSTFQTDFLPSKNKLSREKFSIEYSTNVKSNLSLVDFDKKLESDFYTKKTSIGIHNDDYIFYQDDRLIKRYGSQGQQKIFIISLKICEYLILKEKSENEKMVSQMGQDIKRLETIADRFSKIGSKPELVLTSSPRYLPN